MRHLLAVALLLVSLASALAGTQALRARDAGPGLVWVVQQRHDGRALASVLAQDGTRLLDLRAGGRIALVYVPSLAAQRWPRSVWLTFAPPPGLAWTTCG